MDIGKIYTVCWKCNRSVIKHQEKRIDPVTKKEWDISFCSKCGCNFDLEEVKHGSGKARKNWLGSDR